MPRAPQTHRPAGYTPPAQREQQWASRTAESRKWYQSAEWKALRLFVLDRDCWLCQECLRNGITKALGQGAEAKRNGTVANVDHIVPHRGNRELFYGMDNLQSLCGRCHSKKTAGEDGGFGNNAGRQY